jgi:DNA-binding transcriptional regulator YiaG
LRKETLARVEIDAERKVQAAQDELKAAQVKAKEVQKENIVNLLKMGKLSIEDIANVFGVTSAYVKQIEREIL